MKTQTGQKLTMIQVGSMLANTIRAEIKIVGEHNGEPIMSLKGKRKKFYFRPKNTDMIFEGWDLPIDSNTNENYGENGCVTFQLSGAGMMIINREKPGDIEATWKYIEENNLNELLSDEEKKRIVLHHQGKEVGRVFPELQ